MKVVPFKEFKLEYFTSKFKLYCGNRSLRVVKKNFQVMKYI